MHDILPGRSLAVAMLVVAASLPARAEQTFDSIAAIRTLPEDEATRRPAVAIRGVVTQSDRDGRIFTVQDESAGIWLSVTLARAAGVWQGDDSLLPSLAPGLLVEVKGVAERGGFAPLVLPRSIRIVGVGPLPPPVPVVSERFFSGCDDCLRVKLSGVAQGFRDDGSHWLLVLERNSRRFDARVPKAAFSDPETTVIDAELTLVGVVAARMNARGEIIYPRIIVTDPEDVRIDTPPASVPFEATKVPLRAIAHFQPEPLGGHRIRTEGIVTHSIPGTFFNVQDGLIGVRVETRSTAPLRPGDRVEIAGFLDQRRITAGITEAIFHVVGHEPPPPPIRIDPAKIVEIMRTSNRLGLMAVPGDYDGCTISFPARLLDVDQTEAGGLFVLSVEGLESSVVATLAPQVFDALRSISRGSALMVSGILQVENSAWGSVWTSDDERLVLGIRTADDVQVLRSPSWWTAQRLAAVLFGLLAVFAGSLAWVALLRRQVVTQSIRLAGEMRKRSDAAVEFHVTLRERSLLAANLHDTLLQALAGIVLQLDVCRRSLLGQRLDDAGGQLDVAKRMVKHASVDLRSAVWALRTAPLSGRSFAESMAALVEHLGGSDGVSVRLQTHGRPFEPPQFVAGNLMLIAQEAVRNAVNHAACRQVDVALDYDEPAQAITVTIRDDGAGFLMENAAGVEQGHFGLQGMRERAEGLGGRFSIETKPGGGTVVSARVTVQEHDAELDDEFGG